jgi:hypothetical protein
MCQSRGEAALELHKRWWERPWTVAGLALLCAVPLLWPQIPPLLDLPGHMGRYHVQSAIGGSADLQRYYTFEWAIIGNLGVDLLVLGLSKLVGLEPAVKLVVLAIPPLTAAGLLWVAHEVHGRVPPTALFAVPLAYNHPFHFGFVNFALSMALALLAFALWLRLGRQGRLGLRAILFVPISMLVWLCHTFGWGTLGILAFSAELVRHADRGMRLRDAALRAGFQCLPLTVPLLTMLIWRSPHGGQTSGWFKIAKKGEYLLHILRDRWRWLDLASLALLAGLVVAAVRSKRMEFSRNLIASLLFLALIYVLMPHKMFNSFLADMRLAPYLLMVAIVAIRMRPEAPPRLAATLAVAGLAFILVRTGATTASYAIYDRAWQRELAALAQVPRGAAIVSFVGSRCKGPWAMARLDHLPGMAIVRRDAYSNEQWSTPGSQLLLTRYRQAGEFARDPSQVVRAAACGSKKRRRIEHALTGFPRHAFDYVWLIDATEFNPSSSRGLQPVWRGGRSTLFRVVDKTQPPPPPALPPG